MKQTLAILGSTGSIGVQTLKVVEENPELFDIYALTANNNVDLLVEQTKKFCPEIVVIANENLYERLKNELKDLPVKVFAGSASIAQVVELKPIDTVVTAMVGYSGLLPTINAIKAGKKIALANKETLVVAGDLVTRLALEHKAQIIPVDSEHSAIFQCLVGENENFVEKIILTASGGPFRGKKTADLQHITAKDALAHPTWNMGAKITIDSATMMNKGFEVIEAKWLFGLKSEQIDVVVQPQSIIHSMVQFVDGSIKAQLGVPDMRHPIQYALTFPQRIEAKIPKIDFSKLSNLTFETPDLQTFKNLSLAYFAMEKGGNMPCILNAANEVVVSAFLQNKIGFLQMSDIIEKMLHTTSFVQNPDYEDYVACDFEVREKTLEMIR
ncbi:MAG: 1-deoxy-D-xylulose-5-phosphate reductoisomerase [Prevotellaceae bacterium]|jgi:1-deoxy-D-xylulose-5-phosphate reductoisomerase|nr:1-deoxy-D-xylulose-5-phosphate reductoisomerase [Prevotellaceae bacterium]